MLLNDVGKMNNEEKKAAKQERTESELRKQSELKWKKLFFRDKAA